VTGSNALVISQNDPERRRIAEAVQSAGLQVSACAARPDPGATVASARPALLVIDLAGLDSDRIGLLRRLTHEPWRPAVIAIASSDSEIVEALGEGVDVCLGQGAPRDIVAAQALALLRRLNGAGGGERDADVLTAGGLTVDLDRCEASVSGCQLPLTPTEFRLLSALARRPGSVLGCFELLSQCGITPLSDVEARATAKVHVHRIRQKIAAGGGNPRVVRNVRSFGYLLERRQSGLNLPSEDEPETDVATA
jgi:DNA-binding response OmpR family regulator